MSDKEIIDRLVAAWPNLHGGGEGSLIHQGGDKWAVAWADRDKVVYDSRAAAVFAAADIPAEGGAA